MKILTIRKEFEAFECKLRTFEPNIKHLNVNSNHSKGIQSTQMHILAIEKRF